MLDNNSFKFKIEPTTEQEILIKKTFGCRRFIWNLGVDYGRHPTNFTSDGIPIFPKITDYKRKFPFLKEVDSLALCNAVQDQIQARINHKKNPGHFRKVTYHSKHNSKQSYSTNNQKGSIRILDSKHIKIPKLGSVRIKLHRQIPDNFLIKKATISKDPTGKYYIAITGEYKLIIPSKELDKSKAIGLDYSLPDFYVDSQGNKAGYPHYFYKMEKKLARNQRKLSKRFKGSNNYSKQTIKIARIYRKISNCRKDFCHKLSKRLVSQYDYIFVEDRSTSMPNYNYGGRYKSSTSSKT